PSPTPKPTKAPSQTEVVDEEQEFSYDATVTANELNLRKKASTESDVLATFTKNQELTVLNAQAQEDGIWYRVAATVNKKTLVGYLFSPYVKLDFTQTVYANVTGGALKLRSKANAKAVYVTKESGSVLSIANKKSVKLLSETTVSQTKWFEVEVEVSGKTYTGYATADRLALAAEPTPTPTPSPTPTATPTPTPTPTPTATPTPTPTPTLLPTQGVEPSPSPTPMQAGSVTPQPSPTGALPTKGQAKIAGVTALALKELPQYGSKLIKNASGFSVVVGTENVFEVLDAVEDGENRWYHVVYKQDGAEYVGYINADYIQFIEGGDIFWEETENPTPTDIPTQNPEDFEALLSAQNFPESYKAALRELHAMHPTWKFLANHTGLDWETAVDNESVVGRNLISNTKGAAWKSFEPNAYNWKTDTFVVYDGSTWVTASREANAYYMDPRNFLDETNIFQFELLTYEPAYQTVEGVESILKNTAMEQKVVNYTDENGNAASMTYGEIFVRAAEYSGVSPFHLASRVKQEVVVGTNSLSNSVSGTVSGFEGLYNYYNIGAYHSTVAGGAIANGLKYAKNGSTNAALNESMLIPWTDPYRAILGGAYYIGYSYINRGQNTIYLQKFNMTPTSTYSHQYMANIEAPYSEGRKVAGAYAEFGDLPIVFSIPVYLNMPQEACPEPQVAYNPNNWLKNLSVKDTAGNELVLTPTFDVSVDQEYYIVVENSCDMVEVSAQAVSSLATVNGNTWYPLTVGNNEIVVAVTAENGEVREYRITVARSE
ncbi:MAG: SH3 domain-containing protein, partial [Lachnospiraceae bacterium]|nr:SH3 domain-containing protein [Lachnospiraceae bacterium]